MSRKRIVPCTHKVQRVMGLLEEAAQGRAHTSDPIMEQLKSCPEAFKVGELLSRACDSRKFTQDEAVHEERYLPPSGAVIPPLA